MKIQDAIRSQKPFKLKEFNDYLYVKKHPVIGVEHFYWVSDDIACGLFPVYAILSEEWEVMEVSNNVLQFPVRNKP